MDLTARLDAMEAAIKKPSFRQSSGKANEVNYWIFDYPPEKELEVRERIEYMKNKNQKGNDEYQLVVFDLYDIIIDFLERKNFVDKCCDFEKKRGFGRIVKAVSNSMKVSESDSLIVQYIQENTPENAIVFLTGKPFCDGRRIPAPPSLRMTMTASSATLVVPSPPCKASMTGAGSFT